MQNQDPMENHATLSCSISEQLNPGFFLFFSFYIAVSSVDLYFLERGRDGKGGRKWEGGEPMIFGGG